MAARDPNNSGFDLLGYAAMIAAVIHGAVILGVDFVPEEHIPPPETATNLKVVLVQPPQEAEKVPEDARLLAQANRQGDGDEQESAVADAAPPPLPLPPAQTEIVPAPSLPPPSPRPAAPEPAEDTTERPELTAKRIDEAPAAAPRTPPSEPEPAAPTPEDKPEPVRRVVSAADLFASRNEEIARLTSELDRKSNAYASRLRRKAVNASTAEYKYAAYLEAWRRKVENIGNLNYPDQARRQKLYGNLMLHVAVRSDGSVERIRVLHSSGHKILDDAAIRIVKLAAPFAPFPPKIRQEVDVLDITRTWQFLSSNRLGWQ